MLRFFTLTFLLVALFSLRLKADNNQGKTSTCDCIGIEPGDLFCGDNKFGCLENHAYRCVDGNSSCDLGFSNSCKTCNEPDCNNTSNSDDD